MTAPTRPTDRPKRVRKPEGKRDRAKRRRAKAPPPPPPERLYLVHGRAYRLTLTNGRISEYVMWDEVAMRFRGVRSHRGFALDDIARVQSIGVSKTGCYDMRATMPMVDISQCFLGLHAPAEPPRATDVGVWRHPYCRYREAV